MVDRIETIKTELTVDELVRGYAGMTDLQATNDLNTVYRPAENGVGNMLNYCIINRSRTSNGTDLTPLPILGRLHEVAEAAIGADPFGTTIVANQVSLEMKTWARTFLIALTSPNLSTLNFIDTEVDAGYLILGPSQAVVWKTPDIDALKAFSQNQQSRGQELGIGEVKESHVTEARA